jgi:hypothetical protein
LVGMVFGMIHGAHVCEAEGISLEQFAALLPAGGRCHVNGLPGQWAAV